MAKNKTINVKGTEITVFQGEQSDYISLTDIAKHKDAANTTTGASVPQDHLMPFSSSPIVSGHLKNR